MASKISRFSKLEHQRAAVMLSHALALGDFDGWAAASAVWAVRLDDQELVALAYVSLKALDPEQAEIVIAAYLGDTGPGMPQAAFFGKMDEASFWADMASDDELKAYAVACFNRMAATDQAAFLAYVQRRAAA